MVAYHFYYQYCLFCCPYTYISYQKTPLFERFIKQGKHVKIAININITGAFG